MSQRGGGGGGGGGASWYLAQHTLFDQIPELAADVSLPHVCFATQGAALPPQSVTPPCPAFRKINVWLGPAGTISPLHFDPNDNVLCQVVGKKYVRIYSSAYTSEMRAGAASLANTSECSLECDEVQGMRGGRGREGEQDGTGMEGCVCVAASVPFWEGVVGEGDGVYIPEVCVCVRARARGWVGLDQQEGMP